LLSQFGKYGESIKRYGRAAGFLVAGILVIGGILFWRFGTPLSAKNQSSLAPQTAIPVTAGVAQARDVPVFIEGLGTVQAFNRVNVVTRVSGEIVNVFFREGQEVKTGDKLFQIDPRQFTAALQRAQATKEKDEAQLQSAELDLQRYSKLLPQGFQTRQAYDQQRATVGQLKAAVKADEAAIESAQLDVNYSLIRSPIDGRTGQRLVDVGNFVQTGQNSPLVNITQIKPIFVSFNVPAEKLDSIRKNQAKAPLKVVAYGMDDKTVLTDGVLTLIDNRVDPATGTIHLKAKFANAEETLWPGQSVNAHLILSVRNNAVTVPAQTVMQGPDGAYVYVLNRDDVAHRQKVEVAATQNGRAVIGRGLQAGSRVVVNGQYRLTNGSRVKIRPVQAAQSGSAGQADQ
jgi:membrane fusion protein, multidrug efflux system